jgi:3-hydroxybutyryl-CoA dehydrogenase
MKVLVLGSGVMGKGIAKSFVQGGVSCSILSRNPANVQTPDGVDVLSDLPKERPDLIIESVPEEAPLKQSWYARVEEAYPQGVPLASNTSALDLETLSQSLQRPEWFLGVHYFMPADVTPIVEVASVSATRPEAVKSAVDALTAAGKKPIVLKKAVTGLLINRLQHAILHEAYQMMDEGVVSAEDVDLIAREMLGPRMCITGLIEQKDLSGLDVHALAQRTLVPRLGLSREPARCLQDLFEAGHLGVKTGKGFYDWSVRDGQARKKEGAEKLSRLLTYLEQNA